jgi:pre-mRNA-processing factor 40
VKSKKQRKERQARDAFISLLNELKRDGKIKPGTKWSQVFPLFEGNPAYQNMAGQSGSTPIDLFWDVAEEAENSLRSTRNDVWDVIEVSSLRSAGFSLPEEASLLTRGFLRTNTLRSPPRPRFRSSSQF